MPKFRRRKILKWTVLVIVAVLLLGVGYNLVFPDISRLKKEAPKMTAFMKYRQQMSRKAGNPSPNSCPKPFFYARPRTGPQDQGGHSHLEAGEQTVQKKDPRALPQR